MSGSASTMRVSVQLTADASQAISAIGGVRQEVEKLAPAGAAAGQAAGASLAQMGQAAAGAAAPLPRVAAGLRDTEVAARGAGQAVGVTANQMRQLAPQLNDIATQLALGQSPFMILAAQGGQITQIFGGVRNTLAALASFLGPAGITGLLGLGAGGAIFVNMERDARALNDLTQRLRATRADAAGLARDVDQAAQNVSQTSGVGRGDAREVGRIIAGQRNFSGDRAEIEGLIRLSADLARVMGVDVTQAADQFVAKAIRDPAAAAREAAAGGLLGFNDALRRQVELLAASGDRGQAARLVLEQFGRASQGAAEALTPLQAAVQNLGNVLSQAADAIARLANGAAGFGQRAGRTVFDNPPNAPELPQSQWDFARRLATRESSNRPDVMNDQGYVGLYQFGRERLSQLRMYQPADGEQLRGNRDWIGQFNIPGFPEVRNIGQFRENPRAQDAALARHLADIDRAIANIPGADAYSQDGLRAVAHLGGEGGLRRFLAGSGDPADANRTRLSTYYREFGGRDAAMPGGLIGPVLPPELVRARDITRGQDVPSDQRALLLRKEETLQSALQLPGLDPEEAQRYAEALRQVRTSLAALDSPLTVASRQLSDQFERMRAASGAARELVDAEIRARNEARTLGLDEPQTAQMVETRRAQAQAQLNTTFGDNLAQRDQAIAGQRQQLAVAEQGAAAVERATLMHEAETEALRTAEAGTAAYAAQVQQLTERLTKLASMPRISNLLVDQAQRRDRQALDSDLIGASATERAQRTAELRTRERLGAGADTQDGQRAIANERALAANQVELERTQAAYNEIGRVGEQAFDRIGQAVTTGTLTLKDMGRIGQSVVSELGQAFLRLAVINPIKNLAGGNAPTLGDVGGIFARLLGGVVGADPSLGSSVAPVGTPLTTYGVGDAPTGRGFYHSGGIIGGTPTFTRPVNDNLFIGAPRFHEGGILAPDEVPAILQRGEGVFTAEQMAALGRGDHLSAATGGANNITFHMPVNFSGDSGSETDRVALLAQMRAQVMAVLAEAMPDIARTSHAYTMGEISRGGNAARVVGRR